ncbi:hypothetical protein KI387_010633, partial [Taxus chinensis]
IGSHDLRCGPPQHNMEHMVENSHVEMARAESPQKVHGDMILGYMDRFKSPRQREEHVNRPRGHHSLVADHIKEIVKVRPSHYSRDAGGFQEEAWL